MKSIIEFDGLSKVQKKELKMQYIKKEWKSILISYIFIILSSSKPFFSSNNGAIFVLIWFTLSILLSINTYVNQSDCMMSNKKAKKYKKRHKYEKVEGIFNVSPEIGGWQFIIAQFIVANLFYLITVTIAVYLQYMNLEIYKKKYMELFVGIFADTFVLTFFNGIVKLVMESIHDFINDKTMFKKKILKIKAKNVVLFLSVSIIMFFSLHHYVNKEFASLFGEISRKCIGIVYIIFIICPNIKQKNKP